MINGEYLYKKYLCTLKQNDNKKFRLMRLAAAAHVKTHTHTHTQKEKERMLSIYTSAWHFPFDTSWHKYHFIFVIY